MKKGIRLDKMLGHMGFGTRSELKKAVKAGRVTVDGAVVKDSGLPIDPARQTVAWDGEPVAYRETVYLMLNKPQGVISATEDTRDRTVVDLLRAEDRVLQPFPVGRLDKDTEGLLLLTNDGQLAHELLSPRKHVDKTYEAVVRGAVDEVDKRAFRQGVTLDDGYVTMPAELTVLACEERGGEWRSHISLVIREGKFHQVKRMFAAVGKQVLHLKRTAMGPLRLDESLPPGVYRALTDGEVEALKAHRGAGTSKEMKEAGK